MEFIILLYIFSHVAHIESLYKNLLSAGAQLEAVPSEHQKRVARVDCCTILSERTKEGAWKADDTVCPELYSSLSQPL